MAQLATGDMDDSLDILQDAMLSFVRAYAGKPPEEWGALFYRTLQSRIVDWQRRSIIRSRWRIWFSPREDRASEDDDFIQQAPDTVSPDPAESLYRRDYSKAVGEAVRKLPLRQQQAFLLRAWEGLDVAKTAFAMGCSEGSVKTHYSRAVHTLRSLLKEYRP